MIGKSTKPLESNPNESVCCCQLSFGLGRQVALDALGQPVRAL